MTDNRPGKWGQAFGFEGPVYTWGSKAFDVVLLSVYWTVGCIPVATAGASAAALYYAVDRSVFRDRGTATETFWRAYRENLKKGTAHWLLSLLLGFLFLLNFGICRANMRGHVQWFFCALYLVLTAVVIMNACWLFPMIAEFEMPFGWYLRGSLFCVFRYFPVSLFLLGMIAAGYWSVYRFPLTLIFIPGLYNAVTSAAVRKRIMRFAPPGEDGEEAVGEEEQRTDRQEEDDHE